MGNYSRYGLPGRPIKGEPFAKLYKTGSTSVFMSDFETYLFRERIEQDLKRFSTFYFRKNHFQKIGSSLFGELENGLIKGNTSDKRVNVCYAIEKMREYDIHLRKTDGCTSKLVKLLETGDFEEKTAALKALAYFKEDNRISKSITKYILNKEEFFELGFHVMEKQQGKFVTSLLKIAFSDNNNNDWM